MYVESPSGQNLTQFALDGKHLKTKLEEGHHEAGYRTAQQVLCNSFSAFIACMIWNALFAPEPFLTAWMTHAVLSNYPPYHAQSWCPISTDVANGWSRGLVFAAVGFVYRASLRT